MAQYTDTRVLTEISIEGLNTETIELVIAEGFIPTFQWLEFDTPNVVTWNFDIAISGAEETLLSNLLAAHDRTIWDDIQAETSLYPQGESSDMYYDASTSGLTSSTVQTAIDEVQTNVEARVNWKGHWTTGTYEIDDMVRDGDWTMIANSQTDDRPAPLPIGSPYDIYNGTLSNASIISKTIAFGVRYTAVENEYVTGYSFNTVAGNKYELFRIVDPLGIKEVTQIASFTANSNRRPYSSGVTSAAIIKGQTIDLIAIVNEPDSTPTEFTGDWNYLKPNNSAIASTGEIVHAGKSPDILSINIIDDNSTDRYTELSSLTVGDIIEVYGLSWAIQDVVDNTTYFEFTILPGVQSAQTGVITFSFQSVSETPISFDIDTDYWVTNGNGNIQGLFGDDIAYSDIVPNNNAYGLNITIQDVSVSDDWDIVATSILGAGAPSSTAINIDYDNGTSGLAALNVQDAIDELDARVDVNDSKISADGSIDTHSDVDTTATTPALGDKLIWNGANWIVDKAVYTLADGSVDFTDVATYNAHPSFTSDTDLVDKKYIDDALEAYSLATLQIERTTAFAATNAWVDITFDQTSLETDNTVLTINTTNTDRIDIGADGTYLITARVVPTNTTSQRYDIRVRKNDTTVIPGTEAFVDIYSRESHELTLNCTFSAVDGDYITLQGLAEVSGTFQANSGITITKLDGVKGIDGLDGDDGTDGESAYETAVANGFIGTESQWLESLNGDDGADGAPGPAGSGSTLNVANEGTTLVTGPFDEINFIGNDVNAVANGTTVDVSIESAIYENVINVAKSGGDYTTIMAANDYISNQSPSASNRFCVVIAPGIYSENNPIILNEFISIQTTGNTNTVVVQAQNPASDLFIMANNSLISGFTVSSVTASTAIHVNTASRCSIQSISILNCQYGIHVNHASAEVKIKNVNFVTSSFTITKGVYIELGHVVIDTLFPIGESAVTKLIDVTGNASVAALSVHILISNVYSDSSNISEFLYIDNGSYVSIKSCHIDRCAKGIHIQGDNSFLQVSSSEFNNISGDGIYVPNIGTDIKVSLFGCSMLNIGGYDVNTLNPECTIYGQGALSLTNVYAVTNAKFFASIVDLTNDDEGTNILGELHVGTPLNPSESVFGEGDSYTRGMLVYTYDGSAYVNVSSDAASASGSTFTYPNTSADSAIYLASAIHNGTDYLKHQGFKHNVATAAILGTGNFAMEIWNGTAWVDTHFMVSESSPPYRPRAEYKFEEVGSYQTRYDIELETVASVWTKSDPIGLGVSLYWIRIRIESAITTAPIFEQFKLHSNRTEINSDGFIEFFGNARPLGTMSWSINDATAWDNSPGNIDLFVLNSTDGADYDLGVGRVENDFVTGVTDKISFGLPLPMDMDTSSPIYLEFYYMVNDATAGNLNMKTSKGLTGIGDGVGRDPVTNAPSTIRDYEITDNIVPVAANAENVMLFLPLKIYASKGIARKAPNSDSDVITISIVRDGSNPADTYLGNVAIYAVRANYYRWSNGGYKV